MVFEKCPGGPLKNHHRVRISRSIQYGLAFKIVVSTGWAIVVDHAFNVPGSISEAG